MLKYICLINLHAKIYLNSRSSW
uniref:Uncharacterized protein n=1 Tax=Arundo donax TaxID=35708 RepID=A0A0A8YL98_ARUDO